MKVASLCIKRIAGSVFALLLLLFTMSGLESQDAMITFTHRQRSLEPGEAIVLQARSSLPLKKLSISAFGHEFYAFTEDGGLTWLGLAGIDLDAKPGLYDVRISGIDKNGKRVAGASKLEVEAKTFPSRKLTVDEKYVNPPADTLKRIEKERMQVNAIFAAITDERHWRGPFVQPVPGAVISVFGKRSIYNGQPRSSHSGVDFRGAVGTTVGAPNSGVIVLAENLYYSGNTVILDHGYGLYSYLGHLSAISVKVGDRVKTGEKIGKVGATGVATGPHLHWTIRLSQSRIDPLSLLNLLR